MGFTTLMYVWLFNACLIPILCSKPDEADEYLCTEFKICRRQGQGSEAEGEEVLINGTEAVFTCDKDWEPICVHVVPGAQLDPHVYCLDVLPGSKYHKDKQRCEVVPLRKNRDKRQTRPGESEKGSNSIQDTSGSE